MAKAHRLTLITRLNRYDVESVQIWPEELAELLQDAHYYPWLAALPPPSYERILKTAERVRQFLEHYDPEHDDNIDDLDFDSLEEAGLAVLLTIGRQGLKLPKVRYKR